MSIKQGLFLGMFFAFFTLGFIAVQKATPAAKEQRIYNAIQVYSPYRFEKAIGGLAIVDTRTGKKEKPDAADTLFRMDDLNKQWGRKHLQIIKNQVYVLGEKNQTVAKIFIKTEKERNWLQRFYGI